VLLASTVFLAACQRDSHESVLDEYLIRIARVTDVPVEVAVARPLPPYPEHRALTLDIPRRTIDAVEFFELHGCDMGALVGFRNSPLGRVQTASQRLGYEAAWLAAAERCGGHAADWLAELGADKRRWLPSLFWNATFAADEMRIALGVGGAPAGGDLADVLRGLNDSLTRLEDGEFEVAALESLLGTLRQGSWVGPARRDWSRWGRYLGAASRLLDRATARICLNAQPTPRSRRLQSVFVRFYIEQIQPELARRMGQHQAWVVELERLSGRLQRVQPPAYRTWFRAVVSPVDADSEWRRTRDAVLTHAQAWQRLFAHCGIEPGSGLGQD
jgi:hypothetical protein